MSTEGARRGLFAALCLCALMAAPAALRAEATPPPTDPYSESEGPLNPPGSPGRAPASGAVILPHVPADMDWWNGCSPTAAAMLFGWWEQAGVDAFPGSQGNLPASYGRTSSDPNDYGDARGVIAGWAHKQEGSNQGLTYGSYRYHAADSLADFLLTQDASTDRWAVPHGLEAFAAWDDPRTPAIESRKFLAANYYTSSGWSYADYRAEIDAGRPVHLGLTSASEGHSVLGVGYNDTDGKQDMIVLSTWGWGLQQWEWANETVSGYGFSVYAGTTLQADPKAAPTLSAYLFLAHTDINDLLVEVGVGDPNQPAWSTVVHNRTGGSDDNLVLTDIDANSVLEGFLAGTLSWYLKVSDQAARNTGWIEDFQVRYGFDERVFDYGGPPVAISNFQTSYVFLTTPEPAGLVLLALGGWALARRRRRRPAR